MGHRIPTACTTGSGQKKHSQAPPALAECSPPTSHSLPATTNRDALASMTLVTPVA